MIQRCFAACLNDRSVYPAPTLQKLTLVLGLAILRRRGRWACTTWRRFSSRRTSRFVAPSPTCSSLTRPALVNSALHQHYPWNQGERAAPSGSIPAASTGASLLPLPVLTTSQVQYRYYMGYFAFLREDYATAEIELTFCLRSIKVHFYRQIECVPSTSLYKTDEQQIDPGSPRPYPAPARSVSFNENSRQVSPTKGALHAVHCRVQDGSCAAVRRSSCCGSEAFDGAGDVLDRRAGTGGGSEGADEAGVRVVCCDGTTLIRAPDGSWRGNRPSSKWSASGGTSRTAQGWTLTARRSSACWRT